MRVVRALALPAIVAGLLVFGLTYPVPRPPPPPLSAAELGWVATVRDWLRAPPEVRCARSLPAPPSSRLAAAGDGFADACVETDPVARIERSRQARAELVSVLADRRDLPVAAGLVGSSRIEPRLGEALTSISGMGPVQVRCWAQADWRVVQAEESALTGMRSRGDAFWLRGERALQLQSLTCGPLVRLAHGAQPRARGARADLAVSLWTVAAAAEQVSRRPCVPPARVAMLLGAPRGYAVGLVRFANRELRPVLPSASRRCTTSRPS